MTAIQNKQRVRVAVIYVLLGFLSGFFMNIRLREPASLRTNSYFFNGASYTDADRLFTDIELLGAKKSLYRMEFAYEDYLFDLPKALRKYGDLITILSVVRGSVSEVPDWLTGLYRIEYLQIQDQRITSLPPDIGSLRQMKKLKLGGNKLTSLPKGIGDLTELEVLDCYDNELTALPDSIGNLVNLRVLDVSGNKLVSLPDSLRALTKLKTLYLGNNPLSDGQVSAVRTMLPHTAVIF